ncbi:MAG: DUF2914 domain-containing protein [Candidatus Thiodiazotropha sp.]
MTLLKFKRHLLVSLAIFWLPIQLWAETAPVTPTVAEEMAQDTLQSEAGDSTSGPMDSTTQAKSAGVEESPVPDAYVARAVFTTDVIDREPVDQIVSVDQNATQVMFFTDLRNLQGRTVTHRWEFEGSVISEVEISVKGPRWRAYSVKSLNPGEVGKWTVFVIDESGWPLHASILQQRISEE